MISKIDARDVLIAVSVVLIASLVSLVALVAQSREMKAREKQFWNQGYVAGYSDALKIPPVVAKLLPKPQALAAPVSGPTPKRLKELLHQCRVANRERARIIREYGAIGSTGVESPTFSALHPEQAHGVLDFNEAGY